MRDIVTAKHYLTNNLPPLTENLPSRVSSNRVYFVNCHDYSLDDIVKDGNGVYKNFGRWTWLFKEGETTTKQRWMPHQKLRKGQQMVVKRYFRHVKYPDFRREIIYVSNHRHEFVNNAVIVIYYFNGKEHDIIPGPHGNSKGNSTGYTAVKKSVIKRVAALAKKTSTREAIEHNISSQGGRAQIQMENMPNQQQVKRACNDVTTRHQKATSSFSDIMEWCCSNKNICRMVQLHPEPVVVLATDQQLVDLERFSCIDGVPPITVDPTFNLGDFYVTPITYRNLLLKSKRAANNFSCFCGPILIHFHKTRAAYDELFRCIKSLSGNISKLYAYGTDGELELIKSLQMAFPGARQLRCYRHIEQNALSNLKSSGCLNQAKTVLRSLCTCPVNEFETVFNDILDTYSKDLQYAKFTNYLIKNKDMLKSNVHSSNNNGDLFYTNPSESINSKIKQFMRFRSAQLYNFLDAMKAFFEVETGSAIDGYLNLSKEYKLVDTIQSIGNIMAMTTEEKQLYIDKMNKTMPPAHPTKQVASHIDHDSYELDANEIPHGSTIDFTLTPESCRINVSIPILRDMFNKASQLVANKGIMRAPSSDPNSACFSVISSTSLVNHQVAVKDSGNIVCNCGSYKTHRICSHTVAAGHFSDHLYEFICFHRNNSSGPTADVITQSIDKSRAGMKSNQHKRKRLTKAMKTKFAKATCPTDHETPNLIKYVLLKQDHPNVSVCYGCKSNNMAEHTAGLATKVYRQYIPKGQSMTPQNLKTSFKKEWTYYHLQCGDFIAKNIHICPHITMSQSDRSLLLNRGFSFSDSS